MLINYACSLGGLCHSAELLKRNKFKTCSYPFDWIFSNCDNITHCIENDFKVFLDKSCYTDSAYKWNDNQCGHTFYHPSMFNHHDPRKNDDYTSEELKPHACGFILYDCKPFTDFNHALCAD